MMLPGSEFSSHPSALILLCRSQLSMSLNRAVSLHSSRPSWLQHTEYLMGVASQAVATIPNRSDSMRIVCCNGSAALRLHPIQRVTPQSLRPPASPRQTSPVSRQRHWDTGRCKRSCRPPHRRRRPVACTAAGCRLAQLAGNCRDTLRASIRRSTAGRHERDAARLGAGRGKRAIRSIHGPPEAYSFWRAASTLVIRRVVRVRDTPNQRRPAGVGGVIPDAISTPGRLIGPAAQGMICVGCSALSNRARSPNKTTRPRERETS
jgi:hypothetical protein